MEVWYIPFHNCVHFNSYPIYVRVINCWTVFIVISIFTRSCSMIIALSTELRAINVTLYFLLSYTGRLNNSLQTENLGKFSATMTQTPFFTMNKFYKTVHHHTINLRWGYYIPRLRLTSVLYYVCRGVPAASTFRWIFITSCLNSFHIIK